MKRFAIIALMAVLPGAAHGQPSGHDHAGPHAGADGRAVKSLSKDDLAELRRGGGWGLAKAAELNGVPGPAHLLDLKDEIPLDEGQVAAVRGLFETMRADAIAEGRRLIALEQDLDTRFRDRTMSDEVLRRLLADIADSRRALRYIHLSTHLKAAALLTETQIARYNALRGYAGTP